MDSTGCLVEVGEGRGWRAEQAVADRGWSCGGWGLMTAGKGAGMQVKGCICVRGTGSLCEQWSGWGMAAESRRCLWRHPLWTGMGLAVGVVDLEVPRECR